MLKKIRNAIKGKKTYLTGCAAILVAVVAWSASEVTNVELATAIFIALQTMFVRAGITEKEKTVFVDTGAIPEM